MTAASIRRLALAQGLYLAATGAWPILHLRSFERVTGPKPEGWLAKTAGALLSVTGCALALASRRPLARESALLGAGTAAALAWVDLWYAGARRRISPVYLLDAPLELGFAAGWALAWRSLAEEDPAASVRGAAAPA